MEEGAIPISTFSVFLHFIIFSDKDPEGNYRGRGGPVPVTYPPTLTAVDEAFLEAGTVQSNSVHARSN